mmetsp:Transcript_59594/g.174329  ORF Transcript_59594/g.174329 Transcript_59594/m.174329 type:complete len:90 (+) Transcript_59594:466-735(+)
MFWDPTMVKTVSVSIGLTKALAPDGAASAVRLGSPRGARRSPLRIPVPSSLGMSRFLPRGLAQGPLRGLSQDPCRAPLGLTGVTVSRMT